MRCMRNMGREGGDGKDTMKDLFSSMNFQRPGQQEWFELHCKMDNSKQIPRKVQVKEMTQDIKLLQIAYYQGLKLGAFCFTMLCGFAKFYYIPEDNIFKINYAKMRNIVKKAPTLYLHASFNLQQS